MKSKSLAIVFAVVAVGCGGTSDSESGGGSKGAPPPHAGSSTGTGGAGGSSDPTPPSSCVQRGDEGAANGVGTYCTPGGGECHGTGAPACLADFDPTADQWFCTLLFCSTDPVATDCGADAVCHDGPKGTFCVPSRCIAP